MKTIHTFYDKKLKKEKISMITCYDYSTARLLSTIDLDAVLVGDSLGMVFQGNDDTLSVTVDDMIYHTKAVRKGLPDGFIITDMPFLSYHVSPEDAVRNGGRIIKESGASALKLEGGKEIIQSVRALIAAKIPVMGHLGLTPQSFNMFGGFKVQGKNLAAARMIIEDALALQEAGVFAIVLECVPVKLAEIITQLSDIAIIGIGCGNCTDGQVLVINDALGTCIDMRPKFVKQFLNSGVESIKAIETYVSEVKTSAFPDSSHTFSIDEDIIIQLKREFKL